MVIISLFASTEKPMDLKLMSSMVSNSGAVACVYKVTRLFINDKIDFGKVYC